uniref:DUF4587 domain-containing protein n=1 Tax=Phasianus colchicus TaxID=9054 RepID=A0A669PWP0_PHACC
MASKLGRGAGLAPGAWQGDKPWCYPKGCILITLCSPADLFELMMIQNSQIHQVVMNSLAVSALASFGFGPSPATVQPGEEEEEAMVFHHHYIPYPSSAPLWAWPLQDQAVGPAAVRHLSTATEDREVPVPPPPPPSATGTVGANVPPAPEYYDMLEERL